MQSTGVRHTSFRPVLSLAVGVAVPLVVYYVLRWAGVGVYAALLASAGASGLPAGVALIRKSTVNLVATYFSLMSFAALLLAFVPGSTRFLLARDAVLTAATGGWFLVSLWRSRPLTFVLTRPLLEGRWTWPADWERHWERSRRFRRLWRTSTVLWSIGLIADAAARVVLAFTLPPDAVPALTTTLYLATTVALVIVTNAYYIGSGILNPSSRLYDADTASDFGPRPLRRKRQGTTSAPG